MKKTVPNNGRRKKRVVKKTQDVRELSQNELAGVQGGGHCDEFDPSHGSRFGLCVANNHRPTKKKAVRRKKKSG